VTTDVTELAGEIEAARATNGVLAPPSRRPDGFSIEDGYAVARLIHERRLAAGVRTAGMKLGFTNQTIWEVLGLTSPFWSPIYDDTVTSDRCVSLAQFVAPRIEPEIVLGFRAALRRDASAEEIVAAIGWAAPAFEIVQCHYPDWAMSPSDAIADGGLHGSLVLGEKVQGPIDADDLAATHVELMRQNELIAEGKGSDALGGPVEAISWLLRLPGVEGLDAGAIVTTGSLTAPPSIRVDEIWRAEFAGPAIECRLDVTFG
jgi:2-oxo-3-hexenedioate decarboxylase